MVLLHKMYFRALVYLTPRRYEVSIYSSNLSSYGEDAVEILLDHSGADRPDETDLGVKVCMPALISCELHTEWKTFRHFLAKKTKDDMKTQLKELATNEMLETMFLNLNRLAKICLSIPVGTASVKISFSQMKMIKTRLENRIGESSLSFMMKIAIESPEKLTDNDLENIIDVQNRKPRRIVV